VKAHHHVPRHPRLVIAANALCMLARFSPDVHIIIAFALYFFWYTVAPVSHPVRRKRYKGRQYTTARSTVSASVF
jgi:hypothetical protein